MSSHTHIHRRLRDSLKEDTNTHERTHTHIWIHTQIHTNTHEHTHTHMNTHSNTHKHTWTHTHTHTLFSFSRMWAKQIDFCFLRRLLSKQSTSHGVWMPRSNRIDRWSFCGYHTCPPPPPSFSLSISLLQTNEEKDRVYSVNTRIHIWNRMLTCLDGKMTEKKCLL